MTFPAIAALKIVEPPSKTIERSTTMAEKDRMTSEEVFAGYSRATAPTRCGSRFGGWSSS